MTRTLSHRKPAACLARWLKPLRPIRHLPRPFLMLGNVNYKLSRCRLTTKAYSLQKTVESLTIRLIYASNVTSTRLRRQLHEGGQLFTDMCPPPFRCAGSEWRERNASRNDRDIIRLARSRAMGHRAPTASPSAARSPQLCGSYVSDTSALTREVRTNSHSDNTSVVTQI